MSQKPGQDDLYHEVSESFRDALARLVRAYELDPEKQSDLQQEIHLALWRSFASYESRCSLRTWVYRVAHNTAASYVLGQKRAKRDVLIGMEELEAVADLGGVGRVDEERFALERLFELIHRLKQPDRQLMLLYLEDLDAGSIGEITGLSAGNVRIKIHRIKKILARRFHQRGTE